MNLLVTILASLVLTAPDVLSFDSISHDFGSQPKTVEYLAHEFVFTNVSGHAVSISYAVATCSCTRLSWTTGSVQPGGKGIVKALYTRELGVNSFEKFISVFVEGQRKPYVLRIAGHFYETEKSLADDFPATRSMIGFSSIPIQVGEAYRGEVASDSFWVANLSSEDVTVSFRDCSDSLRIVPEYHVMSPMSRVRFFYEVSVDTLSWGRKVYHATPYAGTQPLEPVSFSLLAVENYTRLSRAEANAGPLPRVLNPDFDFGSIRAGRSVTATYQIKNLSSTSPLSIKSVASDLDGISAEYPASIPPRETAAITVTVPPSALSKGENYIALSIISNSPLMQIVRASIKGKVE